MPRGFLYLVAIMDWFTRKVLALQVSNTLAADFYVETLNEAIQRFGAPAETFRSGRDFAALGWSRAAPACDSWENAARPGRKDGDNRISVGL